MDLESLHSAYVLRRELSKFNTDLKASEISPVDAPSPESQQDAVKVNLGKETSKTELYKHIQDTYDGKGYLSKDTAKKLNKEASENIKELSIEDPSASATYSGYMTAGFSYGIKARFTNNISNTVKNSSNIRKAYYA